MYNMFINKLNDYLSRIDRIKKQYNIDLENYKVRFDNVEYNVGNLYSLFSNLEKCFIEDNDFYFMNKLDKLKPFKRTNDLNNSVEKDILGFLLSENGKRQTEKLQSDLLGICYSIDNHLYCLNDSNFIVIENLKFASFEIEKLDVKIHINDTDENSTTYEYYIKFNNITLVKQSPKQLIYGSDKHRVIYQFKFFMDNYESYKISKNPDSVVNKMSNNFKSPFQDYNPEATKKLLDRITTMSGTRFENLVSDILAKKHKTHFKVTKQSNDYGGDIIGIIENSKVVIQVKRYSGKVGNKAINEVLGAMAMYDCKKGWVVTNSEYTSNAKAVASKAGIRLIDGEELKMIIENLDLHDLNQILIDHLI